MSRSLSTTPAADGFWMPAESDPHAGTWMLWPERPDTWRAGAQPGQQAFVAVATAIAGFEPVTVGASAAQYRYARSQLPEAVRVVEMASNDAWMRDVGPTCVVDASGEVRGIDWQFNAWGGLDGGLYFPWDQDDLVARKVMELEGIDGYRAPFVMEGGSLHVDGEGTVLVTEECLLNRNRNPQLTRADIEARLKAWLGVTTVVWLSKGVVNDETDGHVDNLCCFVRPGEVLLSWTDNPRDPQWAVSSDALERLMAARDAKGRRFKVHKLPSPGPLRRTEAEAAGLQSADGAKLRRAGERLAASYVNFYLANGGLVMPLLDGKRDADAADVLKRVFRDRELVGVPAREILLGGGNIHCITQQIPAVLPHRRGPLR